MQRRWSPDFQIEQISLLTASLFERLNWVAWNHDIRDHLTWPHVVVRLHHNRMSYILGFICWLSSCASNQSKHPNIRPSCFESSSSHSAGIARSDSERKSRQPRRHRLTRRRSTEFLIRNHQTPRHLCRNSSGIMQNVENGSRRCWLGSSRRIAPLPWKRRRRTSMVMVRHYGQWGNTIGHTNSKDRLITEGTSTIQGWYEVIRGQSDTSYDGLACHCCKKRAGTLAEPSTMGKVHGVVL